MGTGVVGLLGRESRIGMYGGGPPRTRLLGRRTIRPKAARRVCHPPIQYLNPLPVARAPRSSKVTQRGSRRDGQWTADRRALERG